MPYLPDGTSVDIVLNPLGGAADLCGQVLMYRTRSALCALRRSMRCMAPESRTLVHDKLLETREVTGKEWLFNPDAPGNCV